MQEMIDANEEEENSQAASDLMNPEDGKEAEETVLPVVGLEFDKEDLNRLR